MDGSQPQTFQFNWFGMQPGHKNLLMLACDLNIQPSLRTAVEIDMLFYLVLVVPEFSRPRDHQGANTDAITGGFIR